MACGLVLVEGIPGSGKTTTAKKLAEDMRARGADVRCYTEGMLHPADTAWCAYMEESEYAALTQQVRRACRARDIDEADVLRELTRQTSREDDGRVLVAYTCLSRHEARLADIFDALEEKELCDGRAPLAVFRDVTLSRWRRFARRAAGEDALYIFECAFLQNQLFELIGTYCMDDEGIMEYMRPLYEAIRPLAPRFVYRKPRDVAETIRRVAAERVSPRGRWIDSIARWVENAPYGKKHGLRGEDGVIEFCRERMRADEMVLDALGADTEILENR